jgi:hypothetical protein
MIKMREGKNEKKISRARKGTGTIIAASFLILIILSGYTLTVILNTKTKGLNEVIGDMNMFDWQRGNEKINIIGNPFDADDTLNISVKNTGEVSINLKWLTVRNSSNLRPILNYSPIQAHLRPGETLTEIGTNIEQVFPGGFEGTTSYVVQILTSRGTVKSLQHPPLEKEYTPVINKIYSGPFEFDLKNPSFNYTSKDIDGGTNNTCWYARDYDGDLHGSPYMCKDACEEYCSGRYWCEDCEGVIIGIHEDYYDTENPDISRPAYEMYDYYDQIVFEVGLKNVVEQPVQIHQSSFLLVIVPGYESTGETELYHYLVDQTSNSYGLIPAPEYTSSIQPNQTGVLKFAARNQGGNQFLYNNSLRGYQRACERCIDDEYESILISYMVIFWKYEGTEIKFGQTIPLASIHLKPY